MMDGRRRTICSAFCLLRDNGTDTAQTTIPGDAGFMVQ